MLEFSKINSGGENYPSRTYDGQEDQSYGFQPAFKLQTGNTRGVQTVGYGNTKIDGANNRIILSANDTTITLGDTSSIDNLTGIALSDTASSKALVTLGRDNTSGSGVTGLISYDASGTRRLLAGTYPDGSVKVKLSQDGYDVATATDDQLIWSSDFNTFKIIQSGTFDKTFSFPSHAVYAIGVESDTYTVTHNLGYKPVVIANTTKPNGYGPFVGVVGSPYFATGDKSQYAWSDIDITDTTVTFSYFRSYEAAAINVDAESFARTVKYYLLRETAS